MEGCENVVAASPMMTVTPSELAEVNVRTLEQAAFIGNWKSMDSPISVSSSNMAARQASDSCLRLRQQATCYTGETTSPQVKAYCVHHQLRHVTMHTSH